MILNFYYGLISGFVLGSFSSFFYFITMYRLKRQFDERVNIIHRNVMDYIETKEVKDERTEKTS